jgi:tetratricopeptide (TPR) repeat protein
MDDSEKANTAMMTCDNAHKGIFYNIRAELLICLFLITVTFVVYCQVRNFTFINYDDNQYVTENQYVKDGLNYKSIRWAFSSYHAANWHPLTWLSHMLDIQLYGLNSGAHHQTNLIFHLLNTILLFFVFRKMTGGLWQSGFVAALFALHPLHVESVAWVAERKDVLSTFFWMLTMYSYACYAAHPGINRYLAVVAFFILGLMAKPMLVTLPFVLLLLDYWPLRRIQFNPPGDEGIRFIKKQSPGLFLLWEKIPLFSLAMISSVVTFLAQKSGGAVGSMELYPPATRLANALVAYVKYIGKMIWPANLAVFYPYSDSLPGWQIIGAGVLLVLITFVSILSYRKRPWFVVGWLWFIGTLVPVIGMVQVGLQAMADRYTYIPLIGVFIIVAWGVPELFYKWRHKEKLHAIGTVVVLTILSITSWVQIQYWKNSHALFRHALDVTEHNYLAHNAFGNALKEEGKSSEATRHYLRALEIKPEYAAPHYSMGHTLATQRKLDDAINHFQKAIQIKPDYAAAHDNLGYVFMIQGKIEQAIMHYSEALRIKPDDAAVHNRLGLAMGRQGQFNNAISHFYKAIKINPLFAEAHYNLGNALKSSGKLNVAIKHYSAAILIQPDFADAQYELATALHKKGNFSEASRHYLELLRINPGHAGAHNNLGVTMLRQGMIQDAITHFEAALRIKPDFEDAQKNLKKTRAALEDGNASAKIMKN